MRILIVDASHAMRRVLTSILAHLGYEDMVESASGPDALMHVQSSHFGLIIADWNMAKMNVDDFVRNVRVTTTARPVPLLLLATVSAGPVYRPQYPGGRCDRPRREAVHRRRDRGQDRRADAEVSDRRG